MGTLTHLTHHHPHPFFLLPTELHTEIFTCACTPSSSSASSPSYYESFYTSLALSRVSRYVRAAAAPARLRAVVLEGWREMVGFLRVLESGGERKGMGCGRGGMGKVRYLTVIADEIPFDPIEMLAERVLYPPPPTTITTTSSSSSTTSTTTDLQLQVQPQPQPHINATLDNRSRRKEKEVLREKMMLHTLGKILDFVGGDLYELELGMQAVVHFRDPLSGFGFGSGFGVGGSGGKGQGMGKQMCFPRLKSLFYACSPAGVYPWASTASTAVAVAEENERFPCLFCPVLNSLTVVISNEVLTPSFDEEGRDVEPLTTNPTDAGTPQPHSESESASESESEAGSESTTARKPNATPFPVLRTLTLLASTPTQALAALDVQDWEVGSEFGIVPAFEFPRTSDDGTSTSGSHSGGGGVDESAGVTLASEREEGEAENEQDLEAEEGENEEETSWVWPPRTLETVVMRPKARWGERWESLRDVVERDREVRERERPREAGKNVKGKGKGKVVVKVLMPGEEL